MHAYGWRNGTSRPRQVPRNRAERPPASPPGDLVFQLPVLAVGATDVCPLSRTPLLSVSRDQTFVPPLNVSRSQIPHDVEHSAPASFSPRVRSFLLIFKVNATASSPPSAQGRACCVAACLALKRSSSNLCERVLMPPRRLLAVIYIH